MTSINGIHTRVLVNAIGMFAPQFSADGLTWFCAGPNCLTWTTANAVCIRLKWFADLIPEVGKVVTKMPDHELAALFPIPTPVTQS